MVKSLSFTDIGKSCPKSRIFNVANVFNFISENKIPAKIFGFTVYATSTSISWAGQYRYTMYRKHNNNTVTMFAR